MLLFLSAEFTSSSTISSDLDRASNVLFADGIARRRPHHIFHLAGIAETHACRVIGTQLGRILVALCPKSHHATKISLASEVLRHGIQENDSYIALTLV